MCNEIAIQVHTKPSDEVICEISCHLINFESGGPAAISGVMSIPTDGAFGIYGPNQLREAIRPPSRHAAESRLVAVEKTANMGGGTVWPLEK